MNCREKGQDVLTPVFWLCLPTPAPGIVTQPVLGPRSGLFEQVSINEMKHRGLTHWLMRAQVLRLEVPRH